MNPALLRRILMWVAPFVVGYIVKKYEEKQNRKQQEQAMAKKIAP
ncbi:hypothetical protein [Chryseobacterium suipulveris]|nr:hypothetical protein [Chryseobacterium suipulveris]